MKCGIVGLPNVGKSTLFNCLSRSKALAANYNTIGNKTKLVIVAPETDDLFSAL